MTLTRAELSLVTMWETEKHLSFKETEVINCCSYNKYKLTEKSSYLLAKYLCESVIKYLFAKPGFTTDCGDHIKDFLSAMRFSYNKTEGTVRIMLAEYGPSGWYANFSHVLDDSMCLEDAIDSHPDMINSPHRVGIDLSYKLLSLHDCPVTINNVAITAKYHHPVFDDNKEENENDCPTE